MTTKDSVVEYYAQAIGTNELRPVVRVLNTRPATIWCPFCDHSTHIGHKPACLNCHAKWIEAAMVDASGRVSEAIGRELMASAYVAPVMPVVPALDPETGYANWTADELAAGADKARIENDLDTMLALQEELENRAYDRVATATPPTLYVSDKDRAAIEAAAANPESES